MRNTRYTQRQPESPSPNTQEKSPGQARKEAQNVTFEQPALLPEMKEKTQGIGPVESGYLEQIRALEESGVMGSEHAGTRSLVLNAARAVDQIKDTDAASGRSNLIKALKEVAQMLPVAPAASMSVLADLRALMTAPTDPCPYDNDTDAA